MANVKNEALLRELQDAEMQTYVHPRQRTLNAPINIVCQHCQQKSLIRQAALHSWPDREGRTAGWVVLCPKCGCRVAPAELNGVVPPPPPPPPPGPVGKGGKGRSILPLLLVVLALAVLVALGFALFGNSIGGGSLPAPPQANDEPVPEEPPVPDDPEPEEPPVSDDIVWEEPLEEDEPEMESYYELIMDDVSWYEAQRACEARQHNGVSGHLATITSEEEYEKVCRLVDNYTKTHGKAGEKLYYIWLGARNDEVSCYDGVDNYQWITGEDWTFDHWCYKELENGKIIDEPSFYDEENNNALEDCLILWGYDHQSLGWTFSDQSGELPTVYTGSQGHIGYLCEYDNSEQVN